MEGPFSGLLGKGRRRGWKPAHAVVFVLFALSACASKAPPLVAPTILQLDDRTQIKLEGSSLAILAQANPPREYPHMAYQSPIIFQNAIQTWAKAHFALTGLSANTLRIILTTGDIVEKRLPMEHGTKAWFKKQQAAEYDAVLSVSVAIVDPSGKVLASADGTSTDVRTSPQDATEADMRFTLARMVTTLFNNLDVEMLPRLGTSLAQFIHVDLPH